MVFLPGHLQHAGGIAGPQATLGSTPSYFLPRLLSATRFYNAMDPTLPSLSTFLYFIVYPAERFPGKVWLLFFAENSHTQPRLERGALNVVVDIISTTAQTKRQTGFYVSMIFIAQKKSCTATPTPFNQVNKGKNFQGRSTPSYLRYAFRDISGPGERGF